MSEAKELARAIAFELSEHFLEIAGDDYRELFLERKIHLAAINELEKQLGEANARIAELEAEVEELKPYRDGYDPENEFPPEGEWVLLRDCDDNFEQVQYDRKMEWYWNYGYNAENFTTWDRFNGDIRRWYPIGKLPEVQE